MKSGEASALCLLKWNILMQLGLQEMLWLHLTRYINALWESRIIFSSSKGFNKEVIAQLHSPNQVLPHYRESSYPIQVNSTVSI